MQPVIISMMTKGYEKWYPTWVQSVKKHFPNADIKIYSINYHAKIDGIKTRKIKCDPEDYKYGRKKVTYLKGKLVASNLRKYDTVIWQDITAILHGTPDISGDYDAKLVYRGNLSIDEYKIERLNYCAEFQVWKSRDAAAFYRSVCNQNKNKWYADQMALPKVHKKYNVKRLQHPDYCNLAYEDDAITWSARGKKDPPYNGVHNEEDEEYALSKFKKYLYNPKPRILAFVDDKKWCFSSTVAKIIDELSYKYDFVPVYDVKDRRNLLNGDYDLIWSRAAAHRVKPLLDYKPEYVKKTITTVTTGGSKLKNRIENHYSLKNQLATIVQNAEAIRELAGHPDKGKVFLIPNGVDTNKFKPRKYPKEFTAGIAARINPRKCDRQKGYSDYSEPGAEKAGVPLKVADQSINFIEHDNMPTFFNAISVLIHPSTAEGCSNTIHEAMACGRVCIITKVGYHGEMCDGRLDSKAAEVIFVDRDVDQIAEVIKELKNDTEKYRRISRNARQFALEHSWDYIIQKYDRMFEWGVKHSK